MVDLHAMISQAGEKGISLSKLKQSAKVDDPALLEELKRLRASLRIAGPFKFGNGQSYYAKGHEPGGETTSRIIEALIRNAGHKLATLAQLEKKIKKPFTASFKDGIRFLVAQGRAVELKSGRSTYLLHLDAVRQLFPRLGEATFPCVVEPDADPASIKERVMEVYHALKREQGGLSAVSIGKLFLRLGGSKAALHQFLLDEAREHHADLHPTTLTELNAEDREGALPLPGMSEPAIMVTFRD